MGKLKNFEKPIGFRDLLPEVTNQKRIIENRLQTLFSRWGYQEMTTPTLEFDQTVGKASAIEDAKMFRLLDRLGNTLVLRPDMTAPIARVVSSILRNETLPIRLSYHANVFRAQENEAGRFSEFYQSGIELIGEKTPDADAEVLTLAIQSLKEVGIDTFQIVVGHMGYIEGLFAEYVQDEDKKNALKEALAERNFVGYRKYVEENIESEKGKESLIELLQLQGDLESLGKALEIASSDGAKQAIEELQQIWQLVQLYQVEANLTFDLTLVPHLEYYTGMVFEGNGEGIGFPVCSGGRYDSLLAMFNNPQYATGFALHMDRIIELTNCKPEKEKKVTIVYDLAHQEEALRYAMGLRNESGIIVVTKRIDSKEEESQQSQAENKESVDRESNLREQKNEWIYFL